MYILAWCKVLKLSVSGWLNLSSRLFLEATGTNNTNSLARKGLNQEEGTKALSDSQNFCPHSPDPSTEKSQKCPLFVFKPMLHADKFSRSKLCICFINFQQAGVMLQLLKVKEPY